MANFNIPYAIEREGQIEFFNNYGIPYEDDDSILVDNTDGVYNGNILEFKLSIGNLNKTLFQAIKYLSKLRIKGESVPATILLIDLNATTAYVYYSMDYFAAIHKVYAGAASKDNDGFVAGPFRSKIDYSVSNQSAQLKRILKGKKSIPSEMYIPIDVDENCIVGWAVRYYRENPKASKGDFLGDETGTAIKLTGEIRDPRHFRGLINPYVGKTNERFKYLMDCLNDRLSKKDLGAFYTPIPYAKKAAELVMNAVDRVPEGNKYIILDRCAGTGNLEEALIGLKDRNGDDLIEHCVVSTYEYYEYKVLQERIGDKVMEIIPPTEANVVYQNGKVANADAMSKEYLDNPVIRQYVEDPKCTIILFENPPYSDNTSIDFVDSAGNRGKTERSDTFIRKEFKKNIKKFGSMQASANEIANLFIWSATEYYMRQETDSYILFAPVKYFKSMTLMPKKMVRGYLFNRYHFHAGQSAISCILWYNIDCIENEWDLDAYDMLQESVEYNGRVHLRRAKTSPSNYYDKRPIENAVETNVVLGNNGYPTERIPIEGRKPVYSKDIIGYIEFCSLLFDPKNMLLVRCNWYKGLTQAHGFHLRRDNYLEKLPPYCSKYYPEDCWYHKDVFSTTADGGEAYLKDRPFLKACLIYTCLSAQNKCRSFLGADRRLYQNELCFDDSKAEKPIALQDLNRMKKDKETALDSEEVILLSLWDTIMQQARNTKNYNPDYTYGLYQISVELNTFSTVGTGKHKIVNYDYTELNGNIETMKSLLKAYYRSHITKKMFDYELLK